MQPAAVQGPALPGGQPMSGTLTMAPRSGICVVPEGGLVITPKLMLGAFQVSY